MARLLSIGALVVAAVAVASVMLTGGSTYTIHARFADAGQLVNGAPVQVAGRNVGTVGGLRLTDDGVADVELSITDDHVTPLHEGTTVQVRAVGLSGVANRFAEIHPGPPTAPELPDEAVLPTTATRGIVDLDTLLNALDDRTRRQLQTILREGAEATAPPAARQLNAALEMLDPALSRTSALGRELVRDQAALERLVSTAADVSTTLAGSQRELRGSITATADALDVIAGRREALADSIGRAPAVLDQGTGVLARLERTLTVVDPVLRDLQPLAPRVTRLLQLMVPTLRQGRPVLAEVRKLLGPARRALRPLPRLAESAVPALGSATAAIQEAMPMITGLRPYSQDLVSGLFLGLGGSNAGYYDANGHYARIMVNQGEGGFPGILGLSGGGAGPEGGYRRTPARCPGGAVEPAHDGSNPWRPPEVQDACNPEDDKK